MGGGLKKVSLVSSSTVVDLDTRELTVVFFVDSEDS